MKNEDQKNLPKPELDLPLPEKDLPLPEKELTAGNTKPNPAKDSLQTEKEKKVNPGSTSIPIQTESIPPGQILKAEPEPMKETHSRKKLFLSSFIFGIIFVIILLLIGAVIILSKQDSKPQNTQVVKTQVKPPIPTPASDPTANWKTYQDPDFKLSFTYPVEYGSIQVVPGPEPEGKILQFTNKGLSLGAYIKPIKDGNDRGRSVFDFSGYVERNGKYYFNDWTNSREEEVIPIKIITTEGRKILILNNNSFTVSKDLYGGYGMIGASPMIALINIDTEKYSGIVFDNGVDEDNKKPITLEDFEKILSTFKFTDTVSPTPVSSAENFCPNSKGMGYQEALTIAQNSECGKQGTLQTTKMCNPNGTGYWWLDFKPTSPKSGCNPACVVDVATKKAEINWRCTGLVPPNQ
jgi:hypothetical protein